MALGLVVYDLLYMILCGGLYSGALWVGGHAFGLASAHLPWPLALMASALSSLVALVVAVGLLTALLPRLKPGRYTLMKGTVFYAWIVRSMLRRVLFVPGLKFVLFSSNLLRFLTLTALGARVSFTTNFSTDVDIFDPALLTAGAGAIIGARSLLSGHYIEDGKLVLGEIVIGPRALVAAEVIVGPGVTIGGGAIIKTRASINIGSRVGERAVIGGEAGIDAYAEVAAGAEIGPRAYVAPRAKISA